MAKERVEHSGIDGQPIQIQMHIQALVGYLGSPEVLERSDVTEAELLAASRLFQKLASPPPQITGSVIDAVAG
jgi:hypothetical protein